MLNETSSKVSVIVELRKPINDFFMSQVDENNIEQMQRIELKAGKNVVVLEKSLAKSFIKALEDYAGEGVILKIFIP